MNSKNVFILSLLMVSFFFQAFYINVGYAFKLYMMLVPLMYISNSFGSICNRIYGYEFFWLLTIISFSLTGLYSYDLDSSLRMVIGLIILMFFYVLYVSALKKYSVDEVINAIIISGIMFNIISISLYIYGIKSVSGNFSYATQGVHYGLLVDRGIPRLIGTLKDPNFFIGFNCLFLFISYFNLKKLKLSKYLFLLTLLSSIFTFSIGGLIALIAGLSTIAVQSKKGLIRLIFICLSFVFLFIIGRELFPQIQDFINTRASGASDGSGRFKDWQNAINTFYNNPFGIGIFSFLKFNINELGGNHYVHNTYLEILVEGGIQTLILYLVAIFSLIYATYKLGVRDSRLEFLLPSTTTLLMSFFSLSGFASEYWIFYLGTIHFFLNSSPRS
ncbi:O-antigen ligase family protein [Aliivibrio fischeri]|uniref:O-antigen ligase family protein n=1 Tax=Aliivibrio fischeri TaxID=668 RepID=UPI0007C4DA45|nr:O-antigen ligase family protein [Aliivibrio fischeri]